MKFASKRRIFYPIRAVMLLLILSLLLTGCGFHYQNNDGLGNCSAVKAETKTFDSDSVTLSWHFGVPKVGSKVDKLQSDYYSHLNMYFSTEPYHSKDQEKFKNVSPILVQTVTDPEIIQSCICCSYIKSYNTKKPKKHNDIWFDLTVPEELFVAEYGYISWSVYGVPAQKNTEDKNDQEEFLGGRVLCYKKLEDGKIRVYKTYTDYF